MSVIARRITEWRASHRGFLPLPVFVPALMIGAEYFCVEVVPVGICNTPLGIAPFAYLKRRGSEEQRWENLFHIPGTAWRHSVDDLSTAFVRLRKEIFSERELSAHAITEVGIEFMLYFFLYHKEFFDKNQPAFQ